MVLHCYRCCMHAHAFASFASLASQTSCNFNIPVRLPQTPRFPSNLVSELHLD